MNRKHIVSLTVFLMMFVSGCGKSVAAQVAEQLELGQEYLLEQGYEQAIIAFNKAIELEPNVKDAYYGLGQSYEGLAERAGEDAKKEQITYYVQAEKMYLEVLKLDPLDNNACRKLIAIYENMGELEKLADLGRYYYGDTASEELLQQIGKAFEKIKDIEKFKELYDEEEYIELLQIILQTEWLYDVAEIYAKGSWFYGEKNQDVPEGFGMMVYGLGYKERTIMYIGEWKNGKREGRGLAVWRNDMDSSYGIYVGDWYKDIENGEAMEYEFRENGTRLCKYIGYAESGMATGNYKKLYLKPETNIKGYEYQCIDGIPQSYGYQSTVNGISEDIMALMIENTNEAVPVWHRWAGLCCKECGESNELDDLNAFDHSWAGWGEVEEKFTFLKAD